MDEYGKQNELLSIHNITDECDVISGKIISVGNIDDKIKLGDDIEVKQGNMKDLMIEKEREECEIIVEKMLNEVCYLKENVENRRIEMEENISKIGKITLIAEKIKSSMNFETVQGYGKKNERKEQKESEFQTIISKGKEILNTNMMTVKNGWKDSVEEKQIRTYVKSLNCALNGVLADVKNLDTTNKDGTVNANNLRYKTYEWNKYRFLFLCDIGNNKLASKFNASKFYVANQAAFFSCLSGRTIGMVLDTGDLICKVVFFIIDDGG